MTRQPDLALGRRFGRLVVLGRGSHGPGEKHRTRVECLRCRTQLEVCTARLLAGVTRSCGCLQRELAHRPRPYRRLDLSGQRIGDLLVLEPLPENIPSGMRHLKACGQTVHKCRCLRCGRVIVVPTANLQRKRNPTANCGCRHLKPAIEPTAAPALEPAASRPIEDDQERDQAESVPTVGTGPPVITPQMRAAGFHLSQLGVTRRVCVPVEDEEPAVAFDGDPWNE